MTKYEIATLARPAVMLLLPVLVVLFLLAPLATFGWLAFNSLIFFITRCPGCGTSIYWNKDSIKESLLAVPHETCTECGHEFV